MGYVLPSLEETWTPFGSSQCKITYSLEEGFKFLGQTE